MENTMKNPRMETILTAADIYGLSPHCVRRWAAEGNVISAPHTENAPRIAPISLK